MNQRILKENASYQDIKEILIEKLTAENVALADEIKIGLQSFQRLSTNQRILDIANLIDHKCPIYQKIDTILSASIFIDQFPEKAEKLTDEELTVLTCFASIGDIKYQKECFELYNQLILKEICKKTMNMKKRINYLEVLEDEFENKNKNKNQNEMREFLHNKSTKELDLLVKTRDIDRIFDDIATKEKLSL